MPENAELAQDIRELSRQLIDRMGMVCSIDILDRLFTIKNKATAILDNEGGKHGDDEDAAAESDQG